MTAPAEVIRPSSRDVRRLRAPRALRAPKGMGNTGSHLIYGGDKPHRARSRASSRVTERSESYALTQITLLCKVMSLGAERSV
jgi:hypothetical protein